MSIQEAYLVMYNILNDYYFQESDNHYLASLLSDMDSNVFMDKMSADPATYFDWLSCVERYIVNEEIKDENIILALRSFLRFYQQEFGYQLEDVIDYFDLKKEFIFGILEKNPLRYRSYKYDAETFSIFVLRVRSLCR